MKEKLGKYYDDYEDICEESVDETDSYEDEHKLARIYVATNLKSNKDCILKIINKKVLKNLDYDLMEKQIRREEELTKLCESKNVVKFYRKFDTESSIIFELEKCDSNLKNFMNNNGSIIEPNCEEKRIKEKLFFKKVAIEIAKGLKTIHEKGVMHRDIKPDNIYLKNYEDYDSDLEELEIKIGDFGCSIFIKDNDSEEIGSVFYSAPEVIQGFNYDEKCDIWSFGITLFELYFGFLPYGEDPTPNSILTIVNDPDNFILRKSGINNLDIFFKKILAIEPNERMGFDELFEYIFSKDFMDENAICVNDNEKYRQIYELEANFLI